MADLGELTPCEPPPFNVSLGYLPRPQVPAIEPFSLEQVATAIAGHPRAAAGLPGMPPAPGTEHVRARREPGAQRPGRGSHPAGAACREALPGAAGAAMTLPENESTKHAAALRRAELESERG